MNVEYIFLKLYQLNLDILFFPYDLIVGKSNLGKTLL